MATIRSYQTKDGQTRYMIDYYIPKDIAGTDRPKKVTKRGFKTKKAAEDVLLERQVWLRDGTHERKTQRKRHTFDDLTAQYTEIFDSQPSWKESKQYMVERFSEDFKGRLLSSFTYLEMQKYRVKLTKTRITRKVGRKVKKYGFPTEATVNRYMACLRHMLGCAVEW